MASIIKADTLQSTTANVSILNSSGTEYARFNSSGNLGIGTASPSFPLTVLSPSISSVAIAVNGRSSDNSGVLAFYANDGSTQYATITATAAEFRLSPVPASTVQTFYTNSNERMRILAGGGVCINTTAEIGLGSPRLSLAFNGTTQWLTNSNDTVGQSGARHQTFHSSGTEVGRITTTTTATTYTTSSDYRLKQDITPMTGALAKVTQLKPVTYKWKLNGSDSNGFIAHELAEVCPNAVTGEKDEVDADGNIIAQGIDTSFLVATLTAAIQEQQALITQLQADVAALKAK